MVVLLISLRVDAFSQDISSAEKSQLEGIAESTENATDLSETEEQRNRLLDDPIDLNHASRDELISSGLFDELKADALLNHISHCGKLLLLEELQSIEGFDLIFIRNIHPYIMLNGPLIDPHLKISSLKEQGRHQLIVRSEKILENQKGYITDDSGNSPYIGNQYKYFLKYKFLAGNYCSFGITAEKDAGEDFFRGNNKYGFDFYSAHLFIKPGKKVRTVALGDYQVQFGQGLVSWTGLAFGKSSEIMNIKKQGSGIRPYSSANEYGFLRGMAVSFQLNDFTIDTWESYRNLDANEIDNDTLTEEFISSVGMSGLHRTNSEVEMKHQLKQFISGVHCKYQFHSLQLEMTGQLLKQNKSITKGDDIYEIHEPSGNHFANAGINYSWQFRNIYFFGETASDDRRNLAVLNGVLAAIDRRVAISVLQRNYSAGYYSPSANAFREGSKTNNETGTFAGLQITFNRIYKLAAYVDVFNFPWLKYRVDAPSDGKEWLSQFTYTPSRTTELYLRIKLQDKQNDESEHVNAIDHQQSFRKLNIRFNANYKINSAIEFHNRIEIVNYFPGDAPNETGSMLLHEIQYKPMGKSWNITCAMMLFNSSGYDSRIYAYEQGIPGAAGIPSYYYDGMKYYMLGKLRLNRKTDMWIRFERTVYSSISMIGSGNEEISGSHKSGLELQLRYSFH